MQSERPYTRLTTILKDSKWIVTRRTKGQLGRKRGEEGKEREKDGVREPVLQARERPGSKLTRIHSPAH